MKENTNKVSATAKMCLYQLGEIGDEDAKMLSEKLKLTLEDTQNSTTTTASNRHLQAAPTMMECRYATMMVMAEQSGCRTVVDLPCGYTPRAIQVAKKGMCYLGCDLPLVIEELCPAIEPLIDTPNAVSFVDVDATDYESLKKAFEGIEGPVCINTEGLLMYFSERQTLKFCENISRLLKRYGGCWITADPESGIQYVLNFQAFFGADGLKEMAKAKHNVEAISESNVGKNSLIIKHGNKTRESIQEAIGILASYDLKVERLTVADYMPPLKSVDGEMFARIQEAMKKCCYWKMTVASVA